FFFFFSNKLVSVFFVFCLFVFPALFALLFFFFFISWALAAGFYVYASDGGEPERPLFVIQDMESFFFFFFD
ncbi:hypothetical protein F9877_17360, partial [Morganella morganii]|nr:hypothetical protein [Morganella morganii]